MLAPGSGDAAPAVPASDGNAQPGGAFWPGTGSAGAPEMQELLPERAVGSGAAAEPQNLGAAREKPHEAQR